MFYFLADYRYKYGDDVQQSPLRVNKSSHSNKENLNESDDYSTQKSFHKTDKYQINKSHRDSSNGFQYTLNNTNRQQQHNNKRSIQQTPSSPTPVKRSKLSTLDIASKVMKQLHEQDEFQSMLTSKDEAYQTLLHKYNDLKRQRQDRQETILANFEKTTNEHVAAARENADYWKTECTKLMIQLKAQAPSPTKIKAQEKLKEDFRKIEVENSVLREELQSLNEQGKLNNYRF